MPFITQAITLEDIKAENPETIWWSVNTCWWTHRASDIRRHRKGGLPCDPRGGMLMYGDAHQYVASAEADP